jgi:hypothetical protein
MNKCAALIISLVFMLSLSHVLAQDVMEIDKAKDTKKDTKTYHVKSLDDKNATVKVVPDYVNRVLRITYLKDVININDFWGIPPAIRLLNKKFIEIKYEVRGESNVGLGNTLILCVKGPHLYQAMYALRYANGETGDEQEEYRIRLDISGNNVNNYKLNVHIHDYLNSKHGPETNYVYDNNTVLAFDTRQNVFYSVKDRLYDHFITTKNKTKQKVAGTFPVIILGKETYYFINGRWYTGDLDEEMFEFK